MGFLRISVGDRVFAGDCEAIITHVVSADQVVIREIATGAVQPVPIRILRPVPPSAPEPRAQLDLSLVTSEDWAVARIRYQALKPLLEAPRMNTHVLKEVSASMGRHPATIYRWLQRYKQEEQQAALVPAKRGVDPGHSRLQPEVEGIIGGAIKERYLTRNRIKATQLHRDVALKCRAAGLPVPHVNTVRNRIARIPARTLVEGRAGKRAAREQFEPIKGHFLSGDRPLAVVQIDHTKLDLIVVDEVDRKPLARPWFTVAIDVFSRVVAGFYLSLEAPGAASTGMCVAGAILSKENLLARWEITTRWPVWGRMTALHCDNGKDFRGVMLRQACEQYGIELLFRPVRQPHYGGHIERLMGTFASEIHTLPGTTFSHPGERKGYDSEKHSALTISELEWWIARYIVEIYHQKPHAGLDGRTPLSVYEEGVVRAGLPDVCTSEEKLRLDFMPVEQRAVTVNGIVVDNISYFHDVLRPWINAKEHGRRRRFPVRRDPRDISAVHFFDPELKQYLAIPYRDTSHPPISVWELRETHRRLRQQGRDDTNEAVVFRAYEEMRNIEDAAVNKTKEMRRNIERRKSRPAPAAARSSAIVRDASWWEEEIQPFSEVVIPE